MRPVATSPPVVDGASGTTPIPATMMMQIYGAALDRVRQPVALLDGAGRLLELNDAHLGLVGQPNGQTAGQSFERYLGREAFAEMMGALASVGEFRGRLPWKISDRDQRLLEFEVFLVRSEQGPAPCYVSLATDVTDQAERSEFSACLSEAHEARNGAPQKGGDERPPSADRSVPRSHAGRPIAEMLRNSDKVHALILETTSDLIYVKDLEGRYQYMNPTGCRALGRSLDDVIGAHDDELWPPDLATCYRETDRLIRQFGHSYTVEASTSVGGKQITYLTVSVPYRDETGHLIGIVGVARDITENKATETALQQSQEMLTQALQASKTGLWIWDTVTNDLSYSAEWKGQLGFGEAELPNAFDAWASRLHPDDYDQAMNSLRAWLTDPGGDYHQEFRLRHKDGTYRWMAARASRMADHNGRPVRVLGSHTDITERKRVEEALRASEERLILAAEGPNDALWDGRRIPGRPWHDPDTPIWWSSRARQILGLAAGEPIDTFGSWLALLHPEDVEGVVAALGAHVRERVPYDVVYRLRTTSGSYRWIRGRGQAMWDETGEPFRMSGSCQDITEQKRAEEALRASEELFSKTFRSSPYPVVISELETGLCLDANEAASSLLGYRRDEVAGRMADELGLWPSPGYRLRFVALLKERGTIRNLAVDFRHPSGEQRQCLVSAERIELHGKPCMITVGYDITEQKRAETALLQVAEGVSAVTGAAFFQSLVQHLAQVADADYAVVTVPIAGQASRVRTVAVYGEGRLLDNVEYDLRGTPGERALEGATPYLISTGVRESFPEFSLFARLDVNGYLGVPLTGRSGERLGMVELMKRQPFEQPPEAQSLLRIFISRAAAELERQQAEEALQESQAKLRRITDAVPGVVYQYRVGPDGSQSFPFASRGTVDLLGCQAWELEADAQVGWRAVVPEDIDGLRTSIGASAMGCTPWTHEFRVRSRDGVVRWLRGSSLPERQPDGAIVWYGLFTDVTARREQERQLRFTQFAMDHAADAIVVASPDARIVYANMEACRSLGYEQEEVLRLMVTDIAPQFVPERSSSPLAQLEDGERLHYESVHRTKEGREFPVEVSVRFLEHEGVAYTCATARDITERQMLEQRLRHADRLATLGTITAGVAHELNNPLFVITGHLQLIERNLQRRHLKAIRKELVAAQEAALRATGIVGQFLSTAHASTGEREVCDVALVARRAVALLRGDLRSREIEIMTDFPAALPPVVADPQALMQVFLNLLTNARQALQSTKGTGCIRFFLEACKSPRGQMVECRLNDNGPGILAEHLPRIFDPFFTTKPVGEGTGLGLAICRRIVNELSGTISCQSEPGRGATFIVRLPVSDGRDCRAGDPRMYLRVRK